jgi:hypothetical protein
VLVSAESRAAFIATATTMAAASRINAIVIRFFAFTAPARFLTIALTFLALRLRLLSRPVPRRIRGAPAAQATRGRNALLPTMERPIGESASGVATRPRAKTLIKKGLLSASELQAGSCQELR